MRINAVQYEYLMKPLRPQRVATRNAGNKTLSYLESWDVRAHLIRIFGFCNWDEEVLDETLVFERTYNSTVTRDGEKVQVPMIEVAYKARVRLVIRNEHGRELCRFTEAAVGSASVGEANASRGDVHDNALKTAASDALKRCAINLGTQFGLSLYDNGMKTDVVKQTLVKPEGTEPEGITAEQQAQLEKSLGATPVEAGATA